MPQPPAVATVVRTLVGRSAPVVLLALLALLGSAQGAGAQVVGGVEPRTPAPASAPFDPASGGQSEETDTSAPASGRARTSARASGPNAARGAAPIGIAPATPYGQGHAGPSGPPPAARRVVLRC